MKVVVDVDKKTISDVEKRLGDLKKKTPSVIAGALNRAATSMNATLKKKVRERYIIKTGDLVKYGRLNKNISRASVSKLRVVVHSRGDVLPLDKFKISPKTVNPRRKTPIKIGVRKGGVKAVLGAFVANVNGIKVFERASKSKPVRKGPGEWTTLPIRRLFGPSVPSMIKNDEIKKQIEEQGQKTFQERLDQNIKYLLEKGKG